MRSPYSGPKSYQKHLHLIATFCPYPHPLSGTSSSSLKPVDHNDLLVWKLKKKKKKNSDPCSAWRGPLLVVKWNKTSKKRTENETLISTLSVSSHSHRDRDRGSFVWRTKALFSIIHPFVFGL
ncbi:hypothetical protein VNO77_01746 [Canavalia gladiata]|uniref:Uncharacterized protein n=1 Tax=Canavalia gladiata TaxID=3824 RepID=A0AAN9R5H8_CANGL